MLDGKLFVTQFNDNVTLLNINADGTALLPVFAEGPDGIFGTSDDVLQDSDGILFVANNSLGVPLANPLDVTVGPDGTLWVAEIGSNEITVLAPSSLVLPDDNDSDDDGILNVNDPFLRDASNGTGVLVSGGSETVWEFSQGAGDTTPGPDGFGGGITGHMIDGTTDFEQFLQSESTRPGQNIQLDNVKFVTAAAGGTTTIEEVQNGDPFEGGNSGQFFFHTGFQLAENVDTFTVRWVVSNPGAITGGSDITNNFQQIGGYIGDGSQSNYLKIVAIATNNPAGGAAPTANIQIALENGDVVVQTINLPANQIFNNAVLVQDSSITFELLIDPVAGTAVPQATFVTTTGPVTITGGPADVINLAGSAVLDTILGETTVQGQQTGVAAGLFATNNGSAPGDTFQAVFDSITVTATEKAVAPDAADDLASTRIDTALAIPVAQLLANDSDANPADTLTVTGVSNAQNGTVSLAAGVVTFTPTPGYEGPASFDYTISDGALTDTATVEVDVSNLTVLFRVNANAATIAALPDDPYGSTLAWVGTGAAGAQSGAQGGLDFAVNIGNISTHNITGRDADLPDYVPQALFAQERWDLPANPVMTYSFGGGELADGAYTVNLFVGNGFDGTSEVGERVFDIDIEGQDAFTGVDLVALFGHQIGGMLSWTGQVTDGTIDIAWLHDVENPLINGIEILAGAQAPQQPTIDILGGDRIVGEGDGQVFVSIITSETVPVGSSVTFIYVIEGVSAFQGSDYEPGESLSGAGAGSSFTGSATIQGGSSDFQIPIDILQDLTPESAESFTLSITSVSPGYAIGDGVATITIEDDDTVTNPGEVLYRVNAGGPKIVVGADDATDPSDPDLDWGGDAGLFGAAGNSPYLTALPGDVNTIYNNGAGSSYPGTVTTTSGSVPAGTPLTLFDSERGDRGDAAPTMQWQFDVATDHGLAPGDSVEVRLYLAEIFSGVTAAGQRVFDVAVDGVVPTEFDDIDVFAEAGAGNVGIMRSFVATVDADGVLDLEFLNGVENPAIKAIEIIAVDDAPAVPVVSIAAPDPATVDENGDLDATVLTFPVSFDVAPTGPVTVSYSVDIDGNVTTDSAIIPATGGAIVVSVPSDDDDNGDESVTVTLTGVTSGGATLGSASASATVVDDDGGATTDPLDIDGDGIVNTDDPFAYDGDNGLGRVLTAGAEFTQDFNTATEDPFQADGGFTGILINPAFDPPGASETDPYGDRTVEEKVTIANGALSITSSLEDSNQSGTGLGNLIRDNYQSGMDVSGVQKFEVVTRASSADWVGVLGTNGFAQFGVKVGAGGLDDFIKLVVSDRGTGATAIQLAHNGTLVGGETNVVIPVGITLDASTTYEVRLIVDRSVTLIPDTATAVAGEVSGDVEFFDGAGISMGTVETGPRYVLTTSAFAAAMTNANPLTDGTGGIAYGVSITDGTGPNPNTNQFTADFDFLTIRSLDAAPATPVVSIADAGSVTENGDVDTTVLSFPVTFDVAPTGAVTVEYALDIAGTVTTGLQAVIPAAGGGITVEVPSDAVANGDEAVTVTLTGVVSGTAVLGGQDSGLGTVTEDDASYVPPVDDLFGTPVEISNDRGTPSDGGTLSIGDNVVTATQEGESGENGVRDRDYFTFTVPDGAVLTGIILTDYDIGQDATAEDGFMGIQLGNQITVDPITGAPDAGTSPLLGAIVYEPGNVGANLLALMAAGGEVGTGTGFVLPGFEAALTGQVTMWLNQGAGPNAPTLTFVVEQQGEISIADAPTIAETGDDALEFDTLVFPLTGPANATVTIDYTVDSVPQAALEVTFDANGMATLSVDVARDDVVDADDVTVALTGVSSALYAIGAAASATGTVTEDDIVIPPTGDPIRIEAEDYTSSVVYAPQTVGSASGDEVIFLPKNGATGSATYDLAAKGVGAGTYDIEVGYYDENDGVSVVGLSLNGTSIGSITFDEDTPSNAASSLNIRSQTFFGVAVGAAGELVLNGMSDAGEFARIDYIEFTPVEGGVVENTAPFAPFDLPDASRVQNAAFDFDAGALFADGEENPLTFAATATTTGGTLDGDLPAGVTFNPATGVFGGARARRDPTRSRSPPMTALSSARRRLSS